MKTVTLLKRAFVQTFHMLGNYVLTLIWRFRVYIGPAVDLDSPEQLTVLLISFSRPRNIQPIIRAVLKCRFVNKILVQNNNPEIDINEWVRISNERLHLSNSPTRQGAGSRWSMAAHEDDLFYMAIDDDVFVFPEQIEKLFSHLLSDKSAPHGVHGVLWTRRNRSELDVLGAHVARREAEVDVLHQLYLVTADHVREYHDILRILLTTSPRAHEISEKYGDDIVISRCGTSTPRIHDVGRIPICPTSHTKGIALNQLRDFSEDRMFLYKTITELEVSLRKKDGSQSVS